MESLLGSSLRFFSLGIWTFLIVSVVYAPVYAVAWSAGADRAGLVPVVLLSTILLSFGGVCLPTTVTWFLYQNLHTWGSLNSLISKSWTRTPVWRAALSIKSRSRLIYSVVLAISAAVLGAWHINFVVAIAHKDMSQAGMPVWTLMPFGAVHTLALLVQGRDRVRYPAVHMPRMQQLLDVASPAIRDGIHVWGRAALLSSLLNICVFKPRLTVTQVLVAAITSFCFTAALSWSSHLVNILLAERLNRRGLQHVDHGVV